MDALKAANLDPDQTEAWFAGKAPRRLLAIPFGGPIAGRDMDGEYFDASTDIKPDWFDTRPALWHHALAPSLGADTTVIGKADRLGTFEGVLGEPDEDGWWVDFWFKAGERRVRNIKALAERGAQLFGSTTAIPHMVRRTKGHIDVWPYVEQSLSTSPQNTHSVFRSAKAVLEDFDSADIDLPSALKAALVELDVLRAELPANSLDGWTFTRTDGGQAAKAGRELSSANLAEIEEWTAVLADIATRADSLSKRVRARYTPEPEGTDT